MSYNDIPSPVFAVLLLKTRHKDVIGRVSFYPLPMEILPSKRCPGKSRVSASLAETKHTSLLVAVTEAKGFQKITEKEVACHNIPQCRRF